MDKKGMIEYNGKEIIALTIQKMETNIIQAAVLGSVSSGVPLLEEEYIESYVSVPIKFFDKGEYFILRDNGNFMIEAGIEESETIPYVEDLSKTINYSKAKNKETKNQLEHTMTLMTKALPDWLVEMKKKYE